MDLTPAVFDYRAGFDGGHGERLRFYFQAASLNDRAFVDIFLLEFDDRAVRLDGASIDVFDLVPAKVLKIDLALRFFTAFRKNLDAHVVAENDLTSIAIIDPNFPEERFR